MSRSSSLTREEIQNCPHRQTILIVDDAPANIKILADTLMDDYEICVTTTGEEAIEIARRPSHLDLILLDISMPGMDGYEVCRRLKADDRTKAVPIIFITARSEEEEETKGFELGAVDYITKPFSPEVVKARVSTHLDLKRHRDHLEELVKERAAELITSNERLQQEIIRRKDAQQALRKSHAELELRVEERTEALVRANRLLKQEIGVRRRSEEALKHLLKKQEINIDLAKKLLWLINGNRARYTPLTDNLVLFADVINIPCYAEGGDHFFIRSISDSGHGKIHKTVLSLKDQSGHEVGCVLRSIITDLIHHGVLNKYGRKSLEAILSKMNDEICGSGLFHSDDFFTSLNIELDHDSLTMRYASNGHPSFLAIRDGKVTLLPEIGGLGANIPIGIHSPMAFTAGIWQLKEGDKFICFTDGLTEMPLRNKEKVLSLDELKQLTDEVIQGDRQMPVSDIMNRLLSRISEISNETVISSPPKNTSGDDVTLVCMEVENSQLYETKEIRAKDINELLSFVNRLCDLFEAECYRRGFDSPELRLRMVVEEALINAWKHGSRQDPEKPIIIRWRFGNDFNLEVIDTGDGFDYTNLPDPTAEDNLTKPYGRGIFMMKYFSDGLEWKAGGRHLVVYFHKRAQFSDKTRQVKNPLIFS